MNHLKIRDWIAYPWK